MASRISIALKGQPLTCIEISESSDAEALKRLFQYLDEQLYGLRMVYSITVFGNEVFHD